MDDAGAVLSEAFRLIARGVDDRRSPFHTPAVATIGADGAPELRTVVLRGWDEAERVLSFHTDARAGKVAQMRVYPAVALHMWDPQQRIQLRVSGLVTLHRDDGLASAAWRAATHGSRATYRVVQAPGAAVDDPLDVDALGLDEEAAYANFMLVRVAVATLELLRLAAPGHRRIRFTWPDGAQRFEWLTP